MYVLIHQYDYYEEGMGYANVIAYDTEPSDLNTFKGMLQRDKFHPIRKKLGIPANEYTSEEFLVEEIKSLDEVLNLS